MAELAKAVMEKNGVPDIIGILFCKIKSSDDCCMKNNWCMYLDKL